VAWCVLRDVWARGQEVNVLFGPAATLDSLLVHTALEVRSWLEQSCVQRAHDAVRAETTTAQARALRRRHEFVIAVPAAYHVVERDGSSAVELVSAAPTRSVTVFWRDGAEAPESMPGAALLALQQQSLKRLHGDSLAVDTCRLRVEPTAPERLVLRGGWENRAEVAAGPLVTYFVYDAPRRRLYGVQGQLFAPGQRKRSTQIEIEALMRTFRLETSR